MRAYRSFVGRRVLVRCSDVTYRARLHAVRGRTIVLSDVTAASSDTPRPVDGLVLIELERVLHVQVPPA